MFSSIIEPDKLSSFIDISVVYEIFIYEISLVPHFIPIIVSEAIFLILYYLRSLAIRLTMKNLYK